MSGPDRLGMPPEITGAAGISGFTQIAGVIGDPVRHSLSPALHNAAYAALGFDARYLAFPVRPGRVGEVLAGALAMGFLGLSVTTPHKDAAAAAADQRSPAVERLGAANCIAFGAGVSVAESTDGLGLLDDLRVACGFHPAGQRCAVIGAGGAGRSVALALSDAGAAVVGIVNRTASRAQVAAELAAPVGVVIDVAELGEYDLVVNATSIGLAPGSGGPDDPGVALAASLTAGQLVYDLVYHPARTAFLDAAAHHGAEVRNGLGMLVHQAAHQVQRFTGLEAPLEVMWMAVGGH